MAKIDKLVELVNECKQRLHEQDIALKKAKDDRERFIKDHQNQQNRICDLQDELFELQSYYNDLCD